MPVLMPSATGQNRVPRVLILLGTFNGELWLREQLMSILSQVDVEVRVAIGDDASRDNARALIQSGWKDDTRVHLYAFGTSSGSAGANFRRLFRLVDPSDFDFVALADQDDIWLPRKLISAIEALQSAGALGYSCAVQSFWPDGREQVLRQLAVPRTADFLFEGAGQGCTFVLHQELFKRVRQFCIDHKTITEALHYHDWLIYLLARAWGVNWHFDSQAWMRYRQHEGNEIGSRGGARSISKRVGMIRNGWYRKQVSAALDVFLTANKDNHCVNGFSQIFAQPPSLRRRIRLLQFFLRHGRRRLSDRVVMAVSAAVGWL